MKMSDWDQKTWRFAAPVIISNVTVPLLGAVDMAVVGHLPGAHYLGSVAVATLIFSILYNTMNFLRMGTTGLTAQAYGANNGDEIHAWLARAGLVSVGIGLFIIAVQLPFSLLALDLIAPSNEVRPLSEEYFFIRVWGAPAALLNFAILGWFFGIQNTRAALITQIFMNGVNIILDIWFVMGLGWGVEGVAIATLISEVSAVGLGLFFVWKNTQDMPGHWQLEATFDRHRLGAMFRVNRDIFARSICLTASFAIFTSLAARSGDIILAANAVLLNILTFVAFALDGFANAAEALAGEAYGARNRLSYRAAVYASSKWALVTSIFISVLLVFIGPLIIDALTGVEEVRQAAREYLPWVAAMPVVAVWCYQLDGIFIGTTHTTEMRNGMVISLIIFVLSLAVLVPILENHGAWLSMIIFSVARGVTLGFLFPRIEKSLVNGG
jgi:MATE family multidrug resistance protein